MSALSPWVGGWLPVAKTGGRALTNYLHRPLVPTLVRMVASGGRLVYETFSEDQPRFGSPTEPAYLLRPGELLGAVRGRLRVRGYEDCAVEDPPRAVQRICVEREASGGAP